MEEEKKEIRTSFSTALLLMILAVIVIIIMGCLVFKLYNDIKAKNIIINDLNAQVSELNNKNNDSEEKVLNTSENPQVNETDESITLNNDTLLNDMELFYCEDVIANEDGSYTFKGAICEPYTITTKDFKEMLKKDKIVLEENNLSSSLKNNECIIKKLNDDSFMPYELLSSENSEHFCYISGNDEEGYRLDLGSEFSTVWKKTDAIREYTFSKDVHYLDIESLGYANYMSKEEIEEKLDTLFDYDKDRFKNLIGSYLKFDSCIYRVTEGVTAFH